MEITGTTKIVGVIGWPLTYTLSPTMHNPAIEKAGLDFVYLAFPIRPEELETALTGLWAAGVRGLNVTIPHKERVIPMIDHLSVEARAVGAVNTIKVTDEGLWGGNTDVYGFTAALGDIGFDLANTRVTVAGAGGAGRAIVAAALLGGAASVAVWDVDAPRVEKLIDDFRKAPLPSRLLVSCANDQQRRDALARSHLVVNASPVGMKAGDPSPIDVAELPDSCLVFDAVYNVPETPLLRRARERGLRALGGLTMLMYQGARAFEIWFGVKPDTALMLSKMREKLGL